MKIDWKKLGLYLGAVWIVVGLYMASTPTPVPEPRVEYRTITKTVEVPGPTVEVVKEVPAPCHCNRALGRPSAPKAVAPKAVAPKAVAPKAAPKHTGFVPRPRNPSPDCKLVPAAAYAHPKDVVVASAARQGLTGEPMNILKRCIGAS